jgi:hypothetical protein
MGHSRNHGGRILGLLVVATLAGAACSGSDTVDPSTLPRADAPVLARSVDLDLATTPSGFPQFDDGNGSSVPEPGAGYRLGIRENESVVSATAPEELPADQYVEAGFGTANSPLDAAFGVVCRAKSNDTYYRLGVGNDGTFAIARVVDGASTILTGGGKWIRDRRLPITPGIFSVSATCRGDTLTLTANGYVVATAQDAQLSGPGRAGVFVETFAEPNASVVVNHFVARAFPSRDAVTDAVVTSWDDFVRRQAVGTSCTLLRTAATRAPGEPMWVGRCGGTLTLKYPTPALAEAAYNRLLRRVDADLEQQSAAPNCRKQTGVTGPLYGAGRVACLDLGDATAVAWLNEPNGVVGVARVDDDDRAAWRGYGAAWPPFVLRS